MFMKLNDVAVVPEEVHHHRHLDLEAGLVVVIKTLYNYIKTVLQPFKYGFNFEYGVNTLGSRSSLFERRFEDV